LIGDLSRKSLSLIFINYFTLYLLCLITKSVLKFLAHV
jgi:hypothetical protein